MRCSGCSSTQAPPLARVTSVTSEVVDRRRIIGAPHGLRDRRVGRAGAPSAPVSVDTATVRRLPRRGPRSERSSSPLSVHQLHQLRAALHDRAPCALRPAGDDDGRLRDVPGVPRASTTTRATADSTPSRTPARCAGLSSGGIDLAVGLRRARDEALAEPRSTRCVAGQDHRRQGHRWLPPRCRRHGRACRCASCAAASPATTSRSR